MKVVFVLPSFAGGGAERVVLNLLAGLDRRRFAPALVVLDGLGPLAADVPADIAVHDLARARLRHALPRLIACLRRIEPAAIVSSLGYVNLALLACRWALGRGARILVREANLPSLALPAAPHRRLIALGYRLLYPRADAVLCTSERMVREFAERFGVAPARLQLVRNPVDVAAVRQAAARPLREEGPGPRFIAAGRLVRQKGVDRLLPLFAALPAETRLTILGDGPEAAALRAQVEHLGLAGRVRLEGFEPNPWPRYAGADAFLLPSRWEGMSNAALEALACGTPVIATPESGGIAEVAAEAPAGAVRIEDFGAPFAAALESVVPEPVQRRPKPSLLPAGFEAGSVCRAVESLLLPEV